MKTLTVWSVLKFFMVRIYKDMFIYLNMLHIGSSDQERFHDFSCPICFLQLKNNQVCMQTHI